MAIKTANDNSMSNITALPSGVSANSMILLATTTASNQSNISFTSGIDSTYKEYVFKLYNCTANGSSSSTFQVNFSIDGGSNYNVTKTTTIFWASHYENGSAAAVSYRTSSDLAQSTSFQNFTDNSMGAGADESLSGTLHLFDPSNTTFVKHFTSTANWLHDADISVNPYVAGYCNTTSAVNAVQFKMASGNIDGVIKLYGIS